MLDSKIKALICGFIFSVIFSMLNFYGRCEGISNKVFRLHIIANSDSLQDQSLKLEVRDEILKKFSSELSFTNSLEEAEKNLKSKMEDIIATAQNVVNEKGFNYKVTAEINRSYFNIRKYHQVTLPSGFYRALKINIGEGKGKNWWCVMFPPICLSASEEKAGLEEILNSSELEIVDNESDYIIKLKFLEWFMETQNKIKELIMDSFEECVSFIDDTYEVGFKTKEIFDDIFCSKENEY